MITDSPWDYNLDHDLPESSVTGDRNHLRIRARIPESPVRPRPDRRSAPSVGLRRRRRHLPGRRRPTAGRRPPRRLKSAFQGACAPGVGLRRRKSYPFGRHRPTIGRRPPQAEFIRHPPRQASASANAKGTFPVGAGRPPAEGLHRPNSFGTHGRRPPRRLKSAFPGAPRQASASADAKTIPSVGAGQPPAEGLHAD